MLTLLLAGLLPVSGINRDHVEIVEINSVYDSSGTHTFDQLLFRDGGQIVAWRMCKRRREPTSPEQKKFAEQWKRLNWRDRTPHRAGMHWEPGEYPRESIRTEPPRMTTEYVGPAPYRVGGLWVVLFYDDQRLRRVTANRIVRSWTQYDVEVVERKSFAPEKRRGLVK